MRLRLANGKVVGLVCIGRGAAEGFQNIPACLRFFILKNVNIGCLKENRQKLLGFCQWSMISTPKAVGQLLGTPKRA
jgi:hypothetical protein